MPETTTTPGQPYFAVELVPVRLIEDQPHVLLVTERKGPCINMEALPGGLILQGEGLAAAAARFFAAAAGVRLEARDLFGLETYESSYRHIAAWTIASAYMIDLDAHADVDELELTDGARWAPVAEVIADMERGVHLAYRHSAIVHDAANILCLPDLWPPSATKVRGTLLRARA